MRFAGPVVQYLCSSQEIYVAGESSELGLILYLVLYSASLPLVKMKSQGHHGSYGVRGRLKFWLVCPG